MSADSMTADNLINGFKEELTLVHPNSEFQRETKNFRYNPKTLIELHQYPTELEQLEPDYCNQFSSLSIFDRISY